MNEIIKIENLNKSFKNVKAVQNLSFKVKEGELFAFLGENGAGKSTTINIMCGQLAKDSGTIIIDNDNLDTDKDAIRRKIGVVFQNSVLDSALTVYENLESRASLYGIVKKDFKKRLSELTELLDIQDIMQRTVGKLSGGQRRKIDIARALINKPKILILDEPTTGLDPQTRKIIWSVIFNLRKEEKMTVFLTTHYMEETLEANYVVILDDGKIAAQGTPHELRNKYTKDYISLYGVEEKIIQELNLDYEKKRDCFCIKIKNPQEATKLIIAHPELFNDYEITKGKMDDVFLAITGKNLKED